MSWERVLNKGQGKVETFQAEERMYKGKTSLKGVSAMHDFACCIVTAQL
jgi:hypothetical protein